MRDGLQTETVLLEELRLVALEKRIESKLALGLNAELALYELYGNGSRESSH